MSQSKFSPSKNGKIPEWLPEDDCKRRKAVVSIYVNATTGVNGPTSTYKHWALVFEFEDGPVRVIEGLEFIGLLFPSFSKVKDPSAKFYKRRGSVTISPKEIRHLAFNNPYNEQTYNALTCNCQNWANEILIKLGFAKKKTIGVESSRFFATLAIITAFITGALLSGGRTNQ